MPEIQQPKPAYDFEVFLASSPVFTLEELAAARGNSTRRGAARNQLKRHLARGRVKSIARELYATVPRGVDPERFVPDLFLVAAAARPDGVFAYHSAFELLGAAHSVWHDCTLHCDQRRTALRVGSSRILFLATPAAIASRGAQTVATRRFPRATRQLLATGPERTFVEGLRQPHRIGGLDELMECVRGLPLLDFRLLERVLEIYDEKTLWAAAGWIAEKNAEAWSTPPEFLDQCRRRQSLQHQYLVRGLRGGRLIKDWRLIVPMHLVEEGRAVLPTGRELHRLAVESGFAVAAVEKVIRLAEMLSGVGELEDLARALALKGGTALNLFLGPPSRLSVDLDFNFVGAEGRDEMLAARPAVEHRLQALARSQGFGVQLSAESHGGRKLFLTYARLADGQPDRIEIDVNYLHRVCLLPAERRRMWRPDGEGPWTTLMSWPEIAAGKLVAFLDRAAPRDAWDVPRLVSHAPQPWPPPDLRGLFIVLAGTLPRPLHEYGRQSLDRIRDADVSRLLWPMLIGGERPSAASLREESWSVLAPLLDLSPAEIEFCDRLQAGELRPELLTFDDPEILDRLRRHPALLWKAENARMHSRRGRRK